MAAAAFGPLRRLDLGAVPPLVLAVDPHRLWMRELPDVGAHRFEVAAPAKELVEDVLHVDEDIEIIPHGAADQGHQIGGAVPGIDAAEKHPDGMTFPKLMFLRCRATSVKHSQGEGNRHEAI